MRKTLGSQTHVDDGFLISQMNKRSKHKENNFVYLKNIQNVALNYKIKKKLKRRMTQMLRPFNEQYVFNFIIIKSIRRFM